MITNFLSHNYLVFMYLGAIVLANLTTTIFGPAMSIVNSLLFIGLDLTSRDRLHERWHNNGLLWKMLLLILSGSVISFLLNKDALKIGIASFIAFFCASIVDTIVYKLLQNSKYYTKVNVSNVFSAAVDSVVFPTIAFGGFLPIITLGQFTAKVFGGAVWSYILRRKD